MTTSIILSFFNAFGIIIFTLGVQAVIFLPLTLAYEVWKKKTLGKFPPFKGTVTVLIPAYNEEKSIRATVESALASDYPSIETIVINDGSTDSTEEAIKDLIGQKIRYIRKANGGKASALNAGIEAASGEVVIFTDADSVFLPDTVKKMVRWFSDPSIDAVCGNDAPLRPSTPVQKFLSVTTHIGTGFVRRALSLLRCLPIITGNLGAVRAGVLREINGFREIWGEDLELTFRLYKKRKRIIFDPGAKVMAECPGTLKGLWRQRIRWVRSYIKITFLHKDIFFNTRFAPFSFYLPLNFVNMAVVPLLQVLLLFIMPWAYLTGHLYFTDSVEVLTYLGILFFFMISVYSIALDGDFHDFIYLPYGFLIVPLSYFYDLVAIYSWWKELSGAEERWEKVERRKVFARGRNRLEYVLIAILLVGASSAGTYYYVTSVKYARNDYQRTFDLALSTHFDAWGDWRKAVSNLLARKDVKASSLIGVSAGRPEWVYFKWKGHEDGWSNHQKGSKEDLLSKATQTFHRTGFKVAAFIDIYGPKYIKDHPWAAAVGFDGRKNTEQLGFTELVDGEYGRLTLDMIEYLCSNYQVDIINLTEMPYYSYSYGDADLASYSAFSKKADWPRVPDGSIDRDDRSIWEWRSSLMEGYISKAAAIAHKYKKELYVDVPVSWKNFSDNGMESGLDYRRVLKHADKIVVWNYFYLEGFPPSVSEALSRYLVKNFPSDSFYISIGLWGKKDHLGPMEFSEGLESTLKGGARRIWVTPDSLLSEDHWKEVLFYLERKKKP